VGGHRLLGAYGPDRDPASPALLPNDVAAIMRPPEPGALRTIVGDFTVCPLALARPGWMQPVCIARADHLVLAAQAPGS
jgi:hypothetical protein